MSDAVINEQPEVAVAATEATEVQPVEEATPAVAAADEGDKKTDVADDKKAESMPLKTTTHSNHKDFKKNRKYDPTTQPVTDDPEKIRGQVEFYLSDSNLPTDKFMWESTGGEENKPMPLKTICNFKRMRQFQPYSAVVAALRDSTFVDVTGEEGEEMIQRKTAYVSSSEAQKARISASVYAKGFGDEEPSTQFDVEAFFANHGHVKHVKLRRTAEDLFKGSVFVEFETPDEADAFTKLDPKPTWQGNELLIMKKREYLDEKNRQIKDGEIEPNTNRRNVFFEGKERGGGRGGRGGRGRGRDDKGRDGKSGEWKDRRDQDQKGGFRGGRGGRGRGRGGRGRGFRGGRGGGRDRDNNGRDEKKSEDARANTNDVQMPTIQSTATKNGETNGKRAREDNGGDAPPAKKVDTKTEAVAAQ
ncbi:hypothetical protein C8A00DRAFT_13190 [Chaetomidium leptoderma]|uniref:La domain-containing protein n=1 Tax=Chaetomidium leptoderma TaxID=669021 RepID=A0AAN6ZYS7_9PEZI|nr:hypothetical protein C8A00DRAFT_13190 [Chaetomidium leptoderma]